MNDFIGGACKGLVLWSMGFATTRKICELAGLDQPGMTCCGVVLSLSWAVAANAATSVKDDVAIHHRKREIQMETILIGGVVCALMFAVD